MSKCATGNEKIAGIIVLIEEAPGLSLQYYATVHAVQLITIN